MPVDMNVTFPNTSKDDDWVTSVGGWSAANLIAPLGRLQYEPQRAFDFLFHVPADQDISQQASIDLTIAVESAALPNESNEEIEIHWMGERSWVAGKYSVDSSTVSLRDWVDKDVATSINAWRELVFDRMTGRIGLASSYKKKAYLILVGPGQPMPDKEVSSQKTWCLYGAWPQAVNWGSMDYTSNDVVKIEATIRYDKAIPLGEKAGFGG